MCAYGYCVEQAYAVLNVFYASSFLQFSLTFINFLTIPDFPVTINVFPDIPVFHARTLKSVIVPSEMRLKREERAK